MAIITIKTVQTGLVGVLPSISYINTSDTIAAVTTTGYLNKEVANGTSFSLPCVALVATKASSSAAPVVGVYNVAHVGTDWSLTLGSNDAVLLANTHILVGNASGIATDVAMSGDATMANTGALTIAAGAIDNAKVDAAAAIAFTKLAALASTNFLVGNGTNVATAVAMSGDATMDNAGAVTIAAGAIDSSMMNANMLRYASVTMSAAEFNGAYAASHLLVAAGGADTMLVLESAQVLMTYGTTQFANGGVAHIQYDSTVNGAGIIASTTQAAADFFDAASTANGFNQGIVKQPFATCVNKGLYFANITQAFDTGDSDMVVHVWYRLIPTV